MKEERLSHLGNTLHWLEDQPGQTGSFRGSEESAAASVQQAEHRETSTDSPCHHPVLSSQRSMAAWAHRAWVLKLGLQQTDPGRGLGLASWRQPKRSGVRSRAATPGVRRTEVNSANRPTKAKKKRTQE